MSVTVLLPLIGNMQLPEAFTSDAQLGLCYEKTVIMQPDVFLDGNLADQIDIIHRLLQCMQESNEVNKHDFPYYQLRVRPARWYEAGAMEGVCFELRWGNRELLPKEKDLTPSP